jgi:hypothetical protein
LNRFLKDNDKKFDIISDSGFDTANNCFQSLLRKTRQIGKGAVQHHEAISRDGKKRRSVPLCFLERYVSNDATGHIAFLGVSYILPPVPSMSLMVPIPWQDS